MNRHGLTPTMAAEIKQAHDLIPEAWDGHILFARMIDGKLCCIQPMIYTMAFLVGVTFEEHSYDYDARYCYADLDGAFHALSAWDGNGDPPGPWIKEKISARLGPGASTDAVPPQ